MPNNDNKFALRWQLTNLLCGGNVAYLLLKRYFIYSDGLTFG